ncbi:hypothetical protein EJ110_NYTH37326, partial [Nymphaea thermarum]
DWRSQRHQYGSPASPHPIKLQNAASPSLPPHPLPSVSLIRDRRSPVETRSKCVGDLKKCLLATASSSDVLFQQAEDPTGIPLFSEDGSSKPILLSELAFLSPLRVLYPSKNHICRSIPSSMEGNEGDQIVTPQGNSESCNIPKITDGGMLTKVLTRANSLPVGGRSIQLLTDSGMMLLNCTSKVLYQLDNSNDLNWKDAVLYFHGALQHNR